MNIREIEARKTKMEREIRESVHRAISDFREDSGLSPQSITIEMVEVTTILDTRPKYVLGEVISEVII